MLSRFLSCSIRSPILNCSKICFSSWSICEMVPSDPCLYAFVMLSLISLLYVRAMFHKYF